MLSDPKEIGVALASLVVLLEGAVSLTAAESDPPAAFPAAASQRTGQACALA